MHSREADQNLDFRGVQPTASRYPVSTSQHRREKLSNNLYTATRETVAAPASAVATGQTPERNRVPHSQSHLSLYTPEQRLRRDATRWTLVQGILAPLQFAAFFVSAILIARYLVTSEGLAIATASILVKTLLLYAIMITGSIWEREVFGVYLFAPAFFWEDVFSFLVLALHSAYLIALFGGIGSPAQQMLLALAAYAAYVVNAAQFLLKLRAARRDERLADRSLAEVRA